MSKEYLTMSTDELIKVREEKLSIVLKIREEVFKKIDDWEKLSMEIIEIEQAISNNINDTRHDQNDQSISRGQTQDTPS